MSKYTITNAIEEKTSILFFKIDFITKQIEKKIGVDLNGDGVIGSGNKLLRRNFLFIKNNNHK